MQERAKTPLSAETYSSTVQVGPEGCQVGQYSVLGSINVLLLPLSSTTCTPYLLLTEQALPWSASCRATATLSERARRGDGATSRPSTPPDEPRPRLMSPQL